MSGIKMHTDYRAFGTQVLKSDETAAAITARAEAAAGDGVTVKTNTRGRRRGCAMFAKASAETANGVLTASIGRLK